jgi:hypothetical protein
MNQNSLILVSTFNLSKELTNILDSIDEQLIEASKEENVPMIKHFMREIKPFLTRDITSLLNTCLLMCIQQGNLQLVRLFCDNGALPNGVEEGVMKIFNLIFKKKHFSYIVGHNTFNACT